MDSPARPLYACGPLPDTHETQTRGSGAAPPSASRPPARRRVRNALAGLALAVGSLVCFLGLLELFAWRAQSDVPERLAGSNKLAVSGLDEPDPDLFWRYRPHQDLQWKAIRVRTNAFGLRDRERTRVKPPGVFRILSLGESTTFGDQIDATQTYSYLLEELLNADPGIGRPVEVWNCGICSWSSYQSVRWLERDGLAFQPDLVLFYHEINDFLPTYYRTGDGQALGLGRSDREPQRGVVVARIRLWHRASLPTAVGRHRAAGRARAGRRSRARLTAQRTGPRRFRTWRTTMRCAASPIRIGSRS